MAFNVEIISKTTDTVNGNYGPQTITTVSYTYKGTKKEWKVYPSVLKKYPNLKESLNNLKAGDTVGLETTKVMKVINGQQREVGEISAILAAGSGKPVFVKSNSSPTLTYTPKKEFDQTGLKVGAARNQAIAFLAATKGTKFTLDDVDKVAYEIVKRQAVMEDNVREGKDTSDAVKNNVSDEGQQAAHSYDLDCDVPF